MKHLFDTITSDFKCRHCFQFVTTDPEISGVSNRNHCPYCLYSRHMDLYKAGDRLSACREKMKPIGLTLKRERKKYGKGFGELMIIHQCTDCGNLSINRIAADDDTVTILAVYQESLQMDQQSKQRLESSNIHALGSRDAALVQARLFGWGAAVCTTQVPA